jgi:hypothetical protein
VKHEVLLAILADIKILDRLFIATPTRNGWHLQVTYNEADIDTGKLEQQYSRKWFIADEATESDVVDTAFAAVMRSYDHVVQEHFTYKGKRVFSPHFTIEQRLAMATPCAVCRGPHDDVRHRGTRMLERLDITMTITDPNRDMGDLSEQRVTEEVVAALEHWLHQDMFAQVDDLLRTFRLDLPPAALIGALSITYHAKSKLKNRDAFLAKVETRLKAELGEARTEELLKSRR